MRTRRSTYPPSFAFDHLSSVLPNHSRKILLQSTTDEVSSRSSKKYRNSYRNMNLNGSHILPDDLIFCVLISVARSAAKPADIANMMLTCKRFLAMVMHPLLLAKVNVSALCVKAITWSESLHRFLKRCADAGNVEACYTLGMIHFYCLRDTVGGASLMAKAAMSSHAAALHSLAVIQFNGSGGTRMNKNLKAGVSLCARAASIGHVDGMRELGHCLQDGYGIPRNVLEGRRLLLQANAKEAAAAAAISPRALMEMILHLNVNVSMHLHSLSLHSHLHGYCSLHKDNFTQMPSSAGNPQDAIHMLLEHGGCLLSDFGCNVPPAENHIAHKFLIDWFEFYPPPVGFRMCSYANCGRPETRRNEFRRCSVCTRVNYCSRACQALDWKIRHKYHCQPLMDLENRDEDTEVYVEERGEQNDNAVK